MLIARRITRWQSVIFHGHLSRYLTTVRQQFKYTRLKDENAFRLLQLHQAESEDNEIECTLRHASLDSPPIYEALSYVWGERKANDPVVIVNGQSLSVTRNLYLALSRLRTQERTIWVDAICINQDDHVERTSQVLLMRRIFGQATRTLAWLGEETETTRNAFAHIRDLNGALQVYQKETNDLDSVDDFVDWYVQSYMDSSKDSSLVRVWDGELALYSLLENDWFQRIWIIQEVAVPPSVLLVAGSMELEWTFFTVAINFMRLLSPYQHANLSRSFERASMLQTIRSDVHEGFGISEGNSSLFSYLVDLRNFESTDPRDKSFAIAGLVGDGETAELTPNYAPENNTQRVYHKIAVHYLQQGQGLMILHHAGRGDEHAADHELPSWVPDWRRKRTWRLDRTFSTAGTTARFSLSQDRKILFLKGRIIDTISSLGVLESRDTIVDQIEKLRTAFSSELNLSKAARIMAEIEEPLRASVSDFVDSIFTMYGEKQHYVSGERLDKAIIHTLLSDSRHIKAALDYLQDSHFTRKAVLMAIGYVDEPMTSDAAIYLALTRMSKHKSFQDWCITLQGYFGHAPPGAKEGDIVATIDELHVPFVLRRVEDKRFQLVGECYVHGLMDGEALAVKEGEVQDIALV